MFDVIISTLKGLAPYIAAIALIGGIFMAYKYFTKKPDGAITTGDNVIAAPVEYTKGNTTPVLQSHAGYENRIIGGIQEGDECPECNQKLVVSSSKIVCDTCRIIYGLIE